MNNVLVYISCKNNPLRKAAVPEILDIIKTCFSLNFSEVGWGGHEIAAHIHVMCTYVCVCVCLEPVR